MKSIRYFFGRRNPHNFSDLRDYCKKKGIPEKVSAELAVYTKKRILYDFSQKEIYVTYDFSDDKDFSFEKFYGVVYKDEMLFIKNPKEDIHKLEELGIKVDISNDLMSVIKRISP